MQKFMDLARTLADASGEIICRYFDSGAGFEAKGDASPVTLADREAEQLMRSMISERYPQHGIAGEEFDPHNPQAEYCWVLDPIDGTLSFMTGQPSFGTLVALTRYGIPILGLMNQPVTQQRFEALADHPSRYNGVDIQVRPCPSLEKAVMATTSPYLFSEHTIPGFDALRESTAHQVYGTDCFGYAMLATGRIDLTIESGLKWYDIAALIPLVEGAGGIITDWQGDSLTPSDSINVIAAGDKRVHEQALTVLHNAA